ncbi:MAG: hypothetical protein FWE03_06630 [Firmicutes bacterium]|nr:hypothetical protein [Bacillota bacterium]
MIRVYQDKNNSTLIIKKFIIEENFIVLGGGTLAFDDDYIDIVHAQINEGVDLKYYDLLIRSMLNIVKDLDMFKIRLAINLGADDQKLSVYQRLGFYKQGDYYIVSAKDINFKGSCNG